MVSGHSESHMASLREGDDLLTHAFAMSILAKSQLLQTSTLDPGHVKRVREAIDVDIRKYSDCVTPKVSAAALELAKRLNIDLWRTSWHTPTDL